MPSYVVSDAPERERFEIRDGDEVVGVTEYRRRGDLIAFVHTEIAPDREGHGLARRLIGATLDDVRSRGLAVLPFCPFVRGYIAKHPEQYLDLVPAAQRHDFDLPADD